VGLIGLHHAGLYVASLERSIAFYGGAFGLEVAERFSFGGEQLAFLRVGQARLELIESSASRVRTSSAGVVDHVALEVDDLDALIGRLVQQAVTLLDPAPVPVPALNARILFCEGPDGERIELLEARPVR